MDLRCSTWYTLKMLLAPFMAAATTSASIGQAYNIGGPEGVTGDGYVQTIALIMGVEPNVVHVEISELEAISQRLGLEQVPRIYPFPAPSQPSVWYRKGQTGSWMVAPLRGPAKASV